MSQTRLVTILDTTPPLFVNCLMTRTDDTAGPRPYDDEFDAFFDEVTPIVFGYALRLCGGSRENAADVTQDAWLTMVRAINQGATELPSVGWLIRVVRSRFVDDLRRQQRLQNKLALVWSSDRDRVDGEAPSDLPERINELEPEHRAVLMMFYVDDMPANDVASTLGMSRSATYALLSRARAELDVVRSELA